MKHEITDSPTALAGIVAGRRYTVQNRSGRNVFIETADAAPTDSEDAFVLEISGSKSSGIFRATGVQEVWVWSLSGGGTVVYDEAA